jgi:cation-transporting ATPase 13A1
MTKIIYFSSPKEVDLEGEFEPSLLNSAVYLIQLSMQVSTFAINYQVTIIYKMKQV